MAYAQGFYAHVLFDAHVLEDEVRAQKRVYSFSGIPVLLL
jgi:hypothetical protein